MTKKLKNKIHENHILRAAFSSAFPHTLPVLTGFLVLGIAYGVLMQTKGFGIGWALLMSTVAFCGSMQFVAISLLASAFHPLQAFLLSIMVNARHIFYGISMLDKYKGMGKLRNFLIFTLCDETFSIASSVDPPKQVDRKYFFFAISFLDYLYWATATCIGSLLGTLIHFNTSGLDFVLTALFVVLFLEQWKKVTNRIFAITGVLASLLALWFFGSDNLVIPSMALILISLIFERRYLKK